MQVDIPASKNPVDLAVSSIAAHTRSRTNRLMISGLPAYWIRAIKPVRLFIISAEKTYHEKSFREIFLDNTTADEPDFLAEKEPRNRR